MQNYRNIFILKGNYYVVITMNTLKIKNSFLKAKEDVLALKELFNSWIFHLSSNQKVLEHRISELETRVRMLELQMLKR